MQKVVIWEEIEPATEENVKVWREFAEAPSDGVSDDLQGDVARAVVTVEKAWADITRLAIRVTEFEIAIRKLRDWKGDDRCWSDINDLLAMLPEGDNGESTRLCPPEEMRANCDKYIAHCHNPALPYISPQREIERLEQTNKAALIALQRIERPINPHVTDDEESDLIDYAMESWRNNTECAFRAREILQGEAMTTSPQREIERLRDVIEKANSELKSAMPTIEGVKLAIPLLVVEQAIEILTEGLEAGK